MCTFIDVKVKENLLTAIAAPVPTAVYTSDAHTELTDIKVRDRGKQAVTLHEQSYIIEGQKLLVINLTFKSKSYRSLMLYAL